MIRQSSQSFWDWYRSGLLKIYIQCVSSKKKKKRSFIFNFLFTFALATVYLQAVNTTVSVCHFLLPWRWPAHFLGHLEPKTLCLLDTMFMNLRGYLNKVAHLSFEWSAEKLPKGCLAPSLKELGCAQKKKKEALSVHFEACSPNYRAGSCPSASLPL